MVLFALGFVLGAWLLQQQAVLPSYSFTFFIPFIIGLWVGLRFIQFRYAHHVRKGMLVFIAVVLGFSYASLFASYRLADALPKVWEKRDVELIGVVATMPELTQQGERFHFDVEQVLTEQAATPKHIAVHYYSNNSWGQKTAEQRPPSTQSKFKVGERWRFTVRLKRPHTTYNPHGFDFESWVLAKNIRAGGYVRNKNDFEKLTNFVWRPHYMIEYCRAYVGDRMARILGDKLYAGVLRGLVIGDDSQISATNWDVYLRTGTNHLMSISGLHITMLAGLTFSFVAFIWRRFPSVVMCVPTRYAATMSGAVVAFLYACLAGLSVPTQRTLIMLLTFAIALLLGRRVAVSRVLSIALLLVVLFDPWAVIAPGFWLSFSAVAIITYASANRLRIRHWLSEAINTQWAVTLGLLPLLILMFGQTSIFSPIANAFAIPIISLLVVPLAILGAILPVDIALQLSHEILAFCMQALEWLAYSEMATWQQATPPSWTIGVAVIGVLWMLLPKGFPQRWIGLTLLLPMVVVDTPTLAKGEVHVTVLDVGQGLSVVVKTATHTMLYDTGRRYNAEADAGNKIIVPYLRSAGIHHLDKLVLSHDDDDHNGGAYSVLSQIPVAEQMTSYTLDDKATQYQLCAAGQTWQWDGVYFEVLSPTESSYQNPEIKDNNRSCVIKLSSPHGSMLLTGDIEKSAELQLLEDYSQDKKLQSDVLVGPHHGSKTSSIQAFVQAVSAKHVIFTVGYLNRFNHPKPSIVNRYQLLNNAQIYRSDYHGAITLGFKASTGIQIKAWRKENQRYWHEKMF